MKYYKLLTILMLAGFMACSEKKEEKDSEERVETTLPNEMNEVTVMKLESTDFYHELISNGKLSARNFVDLSFESAEPIARIYVKNGDRVKKGTKLAELSMFRLANKTAQAKDALERAKLELQDLLIGQGYKLEDSTRVPAETLQLVRVKSGYDQAFINYQLAEHEQRNAVLTAPFDGVVANLFDKTHNIASVNKPFCSLIDTRSLEASFTVLESELPLIQRGDPVEITPFALTDVKADGRISEINPLVNADGMVQVKASVRDHANLFEGMNVRVSIHRTLNKQLVVPKSAVVLRSGRQVIFKTDSTQTKAIWVYVQTGLENAEHYTIASSEGDGLQNGDWIITSNNINLAHEAPIQIIGK